MLLNPHGSLPQRLYCSQSTTSSEGITVTASSTVNTKGAWEEIIASTPFEAIGIWVQISGASGSSTATAALLDIGIGASSAESVLIPNLMAGNSQQWANGFMGHGYYFPLYIPAGSRLSARLQSIISSETVGVVIYILGGPKIPGMWVGSRVTAYGADAANSTGTPVPTGSSNSYGTATQIVSSSTNPIKAIQIGVGMGNDTTETNQRRMLRFGTTATPVWAVEDLMFGSSTTAETEHFMSLNWLLSSMSFNIPAGTELQLATMQFGGGGEDRDYIIYGVD